MAEQATPLAAAESARIKIEQRENAIRANAIKQGMEQERKIQALKLAEISATHAGMIDGIKQAHAEELKRHDERWAREEAKHGSARWWSGAATGLMVAGALVATGLAIYTNTIIAPTFDAASRSRFDQMAVEAITQERPPTTNEPRSQSSDR